MNRERLKRKLITYITDLSPVDIPNLESLEYEELLNIYLNILGISYNDLEPMIDQAVSEYKELYKDMYIEKDAIIDETGVLNPMNFISGIANQIRDLEEEIERREQSIIDYQEFLKLDLEDYEQSKSDPDSMNRFRIAELPSDISYDRWVIANYPRIIAELQATLNAKKELLQNIYENYRSDDHNYSNRNL